MVLTQFHGVKILVNWEQGKSRGLFFNINRGIVNRKMKASLTESQRPQREKANKMVQFFETSVDSAGSSELRRAGVRYQKAKT
jgi:hypothetical protein